MTFNCSSVILYGNIQISILFKFKFSIALSNATGFIVSSASKKNIKFPLARLIPLFLALDTPAFFSFMINSLDSFSLYSFKISAVLSVLPSLITITSIFLYLLFSTEFKASSIYFSALYAGIITDTLTSLFFISIYLPLNESLSSLFC